MARADIFADVEEIKIKAHSNLDSFFRMLDTISKFHKYNFDQQASLSFYAGADYSAVAEERIWNRYFHANVKPDATAIELLDDNALDGVKTVYDASDTDISEERRAKLLWKFDAERDNDVFRGIADKGATSVDSILQTCWNLEKFFSGSDYSGAEIMLLSECVGYVLMQRLGFESEAESLADYTITDELVQGTNISLEDVSNISREILNGIQDYVQKGKGRGEDYPLREAMSRVQDVVSLHLFGRKDNQQGNASVETSSTTAAGATQEAAGPEEAVPSVNAPTQNTATDGYPSVAVSPVIEQPSLFDDFSSNSDVAEPPAVQDNPAEPVSSGSASSAGIQQEMASAERASTTAADATQETAEPEEAVSSTEAIAVDPSTDDSSVAADESVRVLPNIMADDSRFSVSASRTFHISPDGKRSNKANPSAVTVDLQLRKDGAAYLDLHTYNRSSGEGLLADDPQAAFDFVQHQGMFPQSSSVLAQAVRDEYLDMMEQQNIQLPVVVLQRRFAVSPDGTHFFEFSQAAGSGELDVSGIVPNNYIVFNLAYNSNGRIDVTVLDTAVNRTHDFKVYRFNDLESSGRVIVREMVPYANSDVISNRLAQEAAFVETRSALQENASRQEMPSAETPAVTAANATQEASGPEEAVVSAEAPAQNTAMDDVSSVAAGEVPSDSVIQEPVGPGDSPSAVSSDNEAVSVVSEMNVPVYHHNRYEWGVIAGENAVSDDMNIRMQLMSDDSVNVTILPVFLGKPEVSFVAKDLADLRTKGIEVFNGIDDTYSGLHVLLSSRYDFLRKEAHRNSAVTGVSQHLIGFQRHFISSSGNYSSGLRQDDDIEFQMYFFSNGELEVYMRKGNGEETGFTAVGQSEVFNKAKAAFAKLLPDSNPSIFASAIIGNFRTMVRSSQVPEFFNASSNEEIPASEPSNTASNDVPEDRAESSPVSPYDALGADDASAVASGNDADISDNEITAPEKELKKENPDYAPSGMNTDGSFDVPNFYGRRAFSLSPDGIDIEEFHYIDGGAWGANGYPSDHVDVFMDYMSNGRIDVRIRNSVTGAEDRFSSDVDHVSSDGEKVFASLVPDGNAGTLSAWLGHHAILMERRAQAVFTDHKPVSPLDEAKEISDYLSELKLADVGNEKAADSGGEKTFDLNDKTAVKEFADHLTYEDIPMEVIPKDIFDAAENGSNEAKLQRAISFVKSMRGKEISDPMGNSLYYAPGNTESIESYALHLIAGQEAVVNNDLSKIESRRVLGLLLSQRTLENPYAVVKQENGRNVYIALYKGNTNYSNGIIVGVEEGQDGRVVTALLSGKKKDKKAALRDLKSRLSGALHIYYVAGLSGYSRPTSEHRISLGNTSLHPFGNSSVSQNAENSKDNNSYSGISRANPFDPPKFHGGRKGEAFQRNIKAIQTLKILESENRPAADKMEKYALLDYSGFGNLSEVFDENNESWKPERDLLKSILTNEEYISSRSSVLSAFYTDSEIISAIYNGISRMGFKSGNILEPSCGSGNFFYDMPEDMRENSHLFGVELDPISGRIARQLYPDANISIQGFETTSFPDGSFDLAITNVPFENYKIQGRSVHDYFLVKMSQQIRPGGLMVAITSRYSMDKQDSSAREDLARNAELVKAIRLPNNAFRNAGTDATTDILVFRRCEKALGYGDPLPAWVKSVPFDGNSSIFVNPYFLEHPEDVLGTLDKKSTAYGFDMTCKPKENASGAIYADISDAMSTIRTEYIPLASPLPVPEQAQNDNAAVYSFFVRGDEVLYRGENSSDIKPLSALDIDEKDARQIKHLIRIRDLTREVIRSQQFTDNDDALHQAQERLSSVYQDYVNAYGSLHSKKTKQIFEEDCSYPLLLSLENLDEKGKVVNLSDIFTKRTIRPHIPPTHVDTAQEALIVSMTEHGKVDLDYMERLTGIGRDALVSELEYKELFWDERTRAYLSADEYLSGDIREKIEWLEAQEKFALRQRDMIVWDELIPSTVSSDSQEYVPKNETEERILDLNTSYSFTSEAYQYFEENADRDFCFAFLEGGGGFYRLPERFTSDPLFCLEAGLRFGKSIDTNETIRYIASIVDAMKIDGLGDLPRRSWASPVLDFLHDGTQEEYPQKRACVHYLRQLLAQYDGSNGEVLVARAANEWPAVWQGWQEKYNDLVAQNELLGLPKWTQELSRDGKNLAALRAVCPKDLEAQDISVRLGAPWIPPTDIEQFMSDTFGIDLKVEYSDIHHGQWKINSARSNYANRSEKASEYSTPTFSAPVLLEKILNLQPAIAKDKVIINGEEKEVINQEKTILAQQKQELIKEAFAKWIWQDEDRKERIVKYYNRHFNNIRPREFDGSYLEFPGMNPEIQLRPHQKDAIAHTLYGGNTLLAHCVGAGKSFEMIASIMEAKRLGLCNKAMMVVPGHLTEQMGAEFLRLYPTANILVATKKDFEKAHRKEFCAKIATHNWDAIILGFTQFEKVAMSKEYIETFLQDELSRLVTEIEIAKENEGKSFTVRQMERQRKSLQEKLQTLQNKKPKDDVVNFEDLGIDRLYVDEAHNFKNLGVITKLQRLPGISTESAQKSMDFYQKVQYINKKTNCKGLVFATGTAISNSMTELYTMQQYLQPDLLEHEGIRHFDTWATTFGEISNVQEFTPEGKGIRLRQRFSRFGNLPELMSLVKEFADIKTEDMLNLPTPEVKYHVESVPASPEQKAMVDALAERAVGIRNKTVDTSRPENNMLAVTNEGRKLALDQRIMNPELPDYPDSKVNRCVGNVFRIWEESKKNKGTQLVFSDFSTPDDDKFNVYNDIKAKLMEKGVPAEEIAFIHDATNEKQKEALFEKVRRGQVRVLLGSTTKLGTGTNVQDKLVASHDLDVPWKPSDLEQRKGRIARQGNENNQVEVYRYVTEGTFDSYMWQILENKQRFISQILTSKSPARSTEDMDELVLSCAEIKAIATGSPLIREKMDLDVEMERLKIARKGFLAEQASRQKFIEVTGPQRIESCNKAKALAEADAQILDSFVPPANGTLIILDGKSFTDEKEAGEAIVKAIRAGHGEELTGFYKGLKFKLSPGFSWKMELVGKMCYSEDVHMGNFAENMKRLASIEERIKEYPAEMDEEIQNVQKNIDEARKMYARPFAREDEYQQKMLRLQELTFLLSEDSNKDKAAIEKEEERRLADLPAVSQTGEGLEAFYADFVLRHMEEDVPWSESLEQDAAKACLRGGYDTSMVTEVILKFSPKIYDAAIADRIVSNAKTVAETPVVTACR